MDINVKEKCSNWKAWHNRMPGQPATLHVVGQCTFPTDGFTVQLKPVVPQGINPKIYQLERLVRKPQDPVPPVVTVEAFEYREQTDVQYAEVHILPDGVSIPVEEAS
jgi:hypothetical protein